MGKGHFWYKISVKRTVLFFKKIKGQFCQVKDTSVGERSKDTSVINILTGELFHIHCFEKDSSVIVKDSSVFKVSIVPKLKCY